MVKLDDFDFKGQCPIWLVFVDGFRTICCPIGCLSSTLLSIIKCNPSAEIKVELMRDEISYPVSYEVHKD